jgi:hypothetical protein
VTPTTQVRLAKGGLRRFTDLADRLPELLQELRNAPAQRRGVGDKVAAVPGVYLLTEKGEPIYVGQTRNLRRRLGEHGRASARENQASFAFNIARAEAQDSPHINLAQSRKSLEADPAFAPLFSRARQRVSAMEIRVIRLEDPELRTVFEVYAAVAFGTEMYNTFETH